MTGLIYKEWKQNRVYILLMIACAAFAVFAVIPEAMGSNAMTDSGSSFHAALFTLAGEKGTLIRIFSMLLGFLGAGVLQNLVLKGDDRKAWGMFIASSPDGTDGFLRIKYEMVFAMIVLMLSVCQLFDQLLSAVVLDVAGKELPGLGGVYMILVFLQILLRAVDLPFMIRFGDKRGSMIKMIIVIILFMILTLVILTNPGDINIKIINIAEKTFSADNASLIVNLFPFFAMAAYFLSYRISCRIYMKGVEQYDK